MERHRCKVCLKSFLNGRALGGHLRSHLLNLPISPKSEQQQQDDVDIRIQLSQQTELASSSSSDKEQDGDDGEEKDILYGLKENRKPSLKFIGPEFASVVLQDRESETESSKNPTRRRSKRTRKHFEHRFQGMKKFKFNGFSKMSESWGTEPEQPVSSISDTTIEEDVAFCLMMLSRDNKWKHKNKQKHEEHQGEDEETEESDEELKSCKIRSRGKYRCETCNKVFKSYQALGGHRASHRKLKIYNSNRYEIETENGATSSSVPAKKIHECPYCSRVFSSGQALGGHKRSHVVGVASNPVRISTKTDENSNLIDLNLPAPIDEYDATQIELSAVSDAEFVIHIKR